MITEVIINNKKNIPKPGLRIFFQFQVSLSYLYFNITKLVTNGIRSQKQSIHIKNGHPIKPINRPIVPDNAPVNARYQ